MTKATETAPKGGLEGIIAAKSRLSAVNGGTGELIYCGYNIDELAGHVSFEEVVHLLHHDHLPNQTELDELKASKSASTYCSDSSGNGLFSSCATRENTSEVRSQSQRSGQFSLSHQRRETFGGDCEDDGHVLCPPRGSRNECVYF